MVAGGRILACLVKQTAKEASLQLIGQSLMRLVRQRIDRMRETRCPIGELEMQNILMKFDPATGEERPYPSHAAQWREWHGVGTAWLFDPWTGRCRDARDVGSDVHGLLIVPAGTLGMDMGGGCSEKDNVACA